MSNDNNDVQESTLLSTAELAVRYRIPVATSAKWRWSGFGPPYVKFGSRVFYRQSDIEDWIASNRRTSTSTPQ